MGNNVGDIDRTLRTVAGIVLLGLMYMGTIGLWGWLGLVLVVTGAAGWCPLYAALGVNTCRAKPEA
jgi:hypothetical protein